MLIPNYDASKHFTKTIIDTVDKNFPYLTYSITPIKDHKLVKWDSPSGIQHWVVEECCKEDLFELLNKIKETL